MHAKSLKADHFTSGGVFIAPNQLKVTVSKAGVHWCSCIRRKIEKFHNDQVIPKSSIDNKVHNHGKDDSILQDCIIQLLNQNSNNSRQITNSESQIPSLKSWLEATENGNN